MDDDLAARIRAAAAAGNLLTIAQAAAEYPALANRSPRWTRLRTPRRSSACVAVPARSAVIAAALIVSFPDAESAIVAAIAKATNARSAAVQAQTLAYSGAGDAAANTASFIAQSVGAAIQGAR